MKHTILLLAVFATGCTYGQTALISGILPISDTNYVVYKKTHYDSLIDKWGFVVDTFDYHTDGFSSAMSFRRVPLVSVNLKDLWRKRDTLRIELYKKRSAYIKARDRCNRFTPTVATIPKMFELMQKRNEAELELWDVDARIETITSIIEPAQ